MGRPPKCNPCCRGVSPLVDVLAVVYGTDQLALLNPSTGAVLATHTIPGASGTRYAHVLVRDSVAYCGGGASSVVKYLTYGGTANQMTTVQATGDPTPYGRLLISDDALPSSTEMLSAINAGARRYSYTGLGTGTLEASYTPPSTLSNVLDRCTGIAEDGADGIICSWYYRSNNRIYVAGYDRDPSSGTAVAANWSEPGGAGAAHEGVSLARLRFSSAATFAMGILPNSAGSIVSSSTPSILTFSATGSAYGSTLASIKLHLSPYSDHWNEEPSSSTFAKHIAGHDVTGVPDEDGQLYATSDPALDDGSEYSTWRLSESGTLVWRYADPDGKNAIGRLSTDPDSGDLFCGWYTYPADGSPFDYGIRRHDKATGDLVWSTTLVSGATIAGFTVPSVQDSARGRMATV